MVIRVRPGLAEVARAVLDWVVSGGGAVLLHATDYY